VNSNNARLQGAKPPVKAMILAAGRGSRLRPLTDTLPKPLVKVNGKPLIEYHLEKLSDVGIKDVVINHAWLGSQLESALGDGSRWHLNIHYSAEPEGGLETAGGIIHALPLLGTDPFLVINGDVYTHYDFSNLILEAQGMRESDRHETLAHLVLTNNPEHNPQGDFDLDQKGRVVDRKAFTFSGMSVLDPKLFDGFETGFIPLAPVLKSLMKNRLVSGEINDEYWSDIGTLERLEQTDSWLRNR